MEHYHAEFRDAKAGDFAMLASETPCNFMLLDAKNLGLYKARMPFEYAEGEGGYFTIFPAKLIAPADGGWYAVVDVPTTREVRCSLHWHGAEVFGPGHRPEQPPLGH